MKEGPPVFCWWFSLCGNARKEVRDVKVRAIKKYSDIIQKKVVEKGTVFEVPEDRAKYLITQGMVELVKDEKKDAVK